MTAYTLPSGPNMSFTICPQGVAYYFALSYFRGLLCANVRDGDGNVLAGSVRCTNGGWLIPFGGRQIDGNFRFEGPDGEYPDGMDSAGKFRLVYYTNEEIAAGA